MWEALERYQPFADLHGFGDAWLKMTTERTERTAFLAMIGACLRGFRYAERAADLACDAVPLKSEPMARRAIKRINKAIAEESK